MIQDIYKIKEELKNYVEIDIIFHIIPGTLIKYITLKDNKESFYLGGEYVKKGNEKIFLRKGRKTWAIQTKIRDNNNFVLYASRFFIHKDNLKEDTEDNEEKGKNIEEYEKIIKSQQHAIDKISNELINYQKIINNQNIEIQKLKNK